jgi:hypothetical protein
MIQHVYVVREFVGCGYTRGHIARQVQITEWKNVRAFAKMQEAEKFMQSLPLLNTYSIEEVLLDFPEETT